MSHFLLLKNVRVENANAISGMTWGFPAPTHFLGFVHALSRKLQVRWGEQASLGGVGIICHDHQVHTQRPSGFEHVFALSRNPLTKEGVTAPFNEEGRMHMTISLVVECEFDPLQLELDDDLPEARLRHFETAVSEELLRQRLAGGTITGIGEVRYWASDNSSADGERAFRRQLLKMLPGFALLDRSNLLAVHHEAQLEQNPKAELLDSWLDFVALCYRAEPIGLAANEEPVPGTTQAQWQPNPKPAAGYLVPLAMGYQSISELYAPGTVARARDSQVPFRFVESIYSIGEWCSLHRLHTPQEFLWRYRHNGDGYLCEIPQSANDENLASQMSEAHEPAIDFPSFDDLY